MYPCPFNNLGYLKSYLASTCSWAFHSSTIRVLSVLHGYPPHTSLTLLLWPKWLGANSLWENDGNCFLENKIKLRHGHYRRISKYHINIRACNRRVVKVQLYFYICHYWVLVHGIGTPKTSVLLKLKKLNTTAWRKKHYIIMTNRALLYLHSIPGILAPSKHCLTIGPHLWK